MLAPPPIQATPPSAPTINRVFLFLQLHLPLDRSWWRRDSAPQGARSTGSYIPRSGGGLWMPPRMGGSALSPKVPVAQVSRAVWIPFFGGCMNCKVGSPGAPCVHSEKPLSGETAWQKASSRSKVPTGGVSVSPSSFCPRVGAGLWHQCLPSGHSHCGRHRPAVKQKPTPCLPPCS